MTKFGSLPGSASAEEWEKRCPTPVEESICPGAVMIRFPIFRVENAVASLQKRKSAATAAPDVSHETRDTTGIVYLDAATTRFEILQGNAPARQ